MSRKANPRRTTRRHHNAARHRAGLAYIANPTAANHRNWKGHALADLEQTTARLEALIEGGTA